MPKKHARQPMLSDLTVGSRLVVRSKVDWRFASIAKYDGERFVITVASPTGFSYRLRRDLDTEIEFEGSVPVLKYDAEDTWRDNFGRYDTRW
ncbi:MAG: hypothetical protein JNL64_12820 [Blastocatellia bacterium]|nr:hypothetical protein [Blastocatellia bacterium]